MASKYGGLTPDADLSRPIAEAEIAALVESMRRSGIGENTIRDREASWRRIAADETAAAMEAGPVPSGSNRRSS